VKSIKLANRRAADGPIKMRGAKGVPRPSSLKAIPGGMALTIRDDCGSRQSYAGEMEFSIPRLVRVTATWDKDFVALRRKIEESN